MEGYKDSQRSLLERLPWPVQAYISLVRAVGRQPVLAATSLLGKLPGFGESNPPGQSDLFDDHFPAVRERPDLRLINCEAFKEPAATPKQPVGNPLDAWSAEIESSTASTKLPPIETPPEQPRPSTTPSAELQLGPHD